jgi:DNA-binding beta-propeller fold protein YncE
MHRACPLPPSRHFRPLFRLGITALLLLAALSTSAQNITFAGAFGSKGAGKGKFDLPVGVAIGPNGDIYVADYNNGKIQKLTESGAFLLEWPHLKPFCLTTDAQGGVYVAGEGLDVINKYQANGTLVWRSKHPRLWIDIYPAGLLVFDSYKLLAADLIGVSVFDLSTGNGVTENYFGLNRLIQRYVRAIVFSPQHQFYLFCQGPYQIQQYDILGNFVRAWGGYGTADGEFRLDMELPCGLALDSQSNLYITDTVNNRIQVFNANGKFLKSFGSPGKDDGQFDHPTGLAFDPLNHELYVADALNNRIQRFLITP